MAFEFCQRPAFLITKIVRTISAIEMGRHTSQFLTMPARRYATTDGYDSGFYLSDGEGRIRNGSLKIDITVDFDKSSFRSGKKVPRPEDSIYRLPVLVTLSDGETASVYTIYVKQEEERR